MSDIVDRIKAAKSASIGMAALSSATKNSALEAMADALDDNRERILDANAIDMEEAYKAKERGELSDSMVKRLKVDDHKIDTMIAGIRDVSFLRDPVEETLSAIELDEGLELYQVTCPIGMVGVIFESRPDVVPQIMSLCLKSGNAVAFKGGSEAMNTIRALFDILTDAIEPIMGSAGFVLMESRSDISDILSLDEYIDLLIPRGSNSFVRYIKDNTRIPVLGHAAGICHVFVDSSADVDKALDIVYDSKVQYPAVCNATETLLVHSDIAERFLPEIGKRLLSAGVEIRADDRSSKILGTENTVPATDEDWDTEYNDLILSVKIVDSLQEAIDFINIHGSHHTDAIVTEDKAHQITFFQYVDSADVFINASTRFADGYRFGKGAEVGISTNKIHSRGPVGMEGLMIYKYVLIGNGHIVKEYAEGTRDFTHRVLQKDLRF